jgi:hypothetical protein
MTAQCVRLQLISLMVVSLCYLKAGYSTSLTIAVAAALAVGVLLSAASAAAAC